MNDKSQNKPVLAHGIPPALRAAADTSLAVGALIYALNVWKAAPPGHQSTGPWNDLVRACRDLVDADALERARDA